MIGVVRNFTLGVDNAGVPTAWFDCYYDESTSVPVTLSTPREILKFLHQAGLLTAPNVNGVPCVLDATVSPAAFVRAANI